MGSIKMQKEVSAKQKRMIWYNQLNTRFEIVKSLRFKEMQVIGGGISVRWLNVQHVGMWDKVRKFLKLDDRAISIYRSVDNYRMIPMMSFNLKKRQGEYDEWNNHQRQASDRA